MPPHNLAVNIDVLRQALEGAKRPVALFLGAGCPMAVEDPDSEKPLIPDIRSMTTILTERLRNSDLADTFKKLELVLAQDDKAGADLEYMLSLVRALKDVAGQDTARGLTANELKELDQAMTKEIVALAEPLLPRSKTAYHEVMEWVGGTLRDWPVEIFTTNYDLLSEQSLEEVEVPFFDGFVGAHRPFFEIRAIEDEKLPERWARLWKLHGSINWSRSKGGRVVREVGSDHLERRLIHPSHLKYDESRRMPYLALHDRLRQVLRQPDIVIVSCGYSFRDEHLNEILQEGLQRNQTAILFGFLFGKLEQYPEACELALRTRSANLILLAEDEAVIGCEQETWREVDDPDALEGIPGVRLVDKSPSCHLGDFAEFGALLSSLTGARQ